MQNPILAKREEAFKDIFRKLKANDVLFPRKARSVTDTSQVLR